MCDYGLIGDQMTRWVNRAPWCPRDGHPQAAAHYLWFEQLEQRLREWDPIAAGQPQEFMPERHEAQHLRLGGRDAALRRGEPAHRGQPLHPR